MEKRCIFACDMLIPSKKIDYTKWAVVACDQYTSEEEYWNKVLKNVLDIPSSYHITLPEIYLEADDIDEKIEAIHKTMLDYLQNDILQRVDNSIILTKRYTNGNAIRRGIVAKVDLEYYDYNIGSTSKIRPTEKTIVERIPPRLKVRQNATIELPHIMLIIDDDKQEIIEPLFDKLDKFEQIYNTELMENGGKIEGYVVNDKEIIENILEKFDMLSDDKVFCEKYGTKTHKPLSFAVGDGNHSLATAKAHYEQLKKTDKNAENHPARYCLVEIVNIHEPDLTIEPIHRIIFDVDTKDILEFANNFFDECKITNEMPQNTKNSHIYPFIIQGEYKYLQVINPKWSIPMGTLQAYLDEYMKNNKTCKIDYIHGKNSLEKLSMKDNAIGFILPDIEKSDLFKGVIFDDVLPRKTFSMGEAYEKRYYMEARKIALD